MVPWDVVSSEAENPAFYRGQTNRDRHHDGNTDHQHCFVTQRNRQVMVTWRSHAGHVQVTQNKYRSSTPHASTSTALMMSRGWTRWGSYSKWPLPVSATAAEYTPGSFFVVRSMRLTQEAQVIPVICSGRSPGTSSGRWYAHRGETTVS